MRVLHAPTLGWRDVDLRDMLARATGMPVEIENSGRVCALAQLWAMHGGGDSPTGDFVFVSASDGLGVGVSFQREVLRGRHNLAGEFGHLLLSMDGPTLLVRIERLLGSLRLEPRDARALLRRPSRMPRAATLSSDFTIDDLLARARGGDLKARAAVQATGRYLGVGLALIVNALDPSAVYVGGEITAAWDLIEPPMRAAFLERALTPAVAATPIRPVATVEYPRLRGAAALVTAPAFAAPVVA